MKSFTLHADNAMPEAAMSRYGWRSGFAVCGDSGLPVFERCATGGKRTFAAVAKGPARSLQSCRSLHTQSGAAQRSRMHNPLGMQCHKIAHQIR